MLSLPTFPEIALVKVTKGYQVVKCNGQFLGLISFDKSAALDTNENSFLLETVIYLTTWIGICKPQPVDQIKTDPSFWKWSFTGTQPGSLRLPVTYDCFLLKEFCSCRRVHVTGEAWNIYCLALYKRTLPTIPSSIPVPPEVFHISVNDNSTLPNVQTKNPVFSLDFLFFHTIHKLLSNFSCPIFKIYSHFNHFSPPPLLLSWNKPSSLLA